MRAFKVLARLQACFACNANYCVLLQFAKILNFKSDENLSKMITIILFVATVMKFSSVL